MRSRVHRRAVRLGLLLLLAGCTGGRDKLLAALQSPRPDERALAVKKLAAAGDAQDLVLFTQAAKDPAAMVRGEAMVALGKSQDPRVVDLLGEALGDPDDGVQAKAAMALAEIKSDKAKAYLTSQYGRRGRSTRLAIVQALKAANVPGAMAAVVAAEAQSIWERNLRALTEGALAERVAAAEELGKSGRAEAVNRLLPLLKESQVVLAAAAVRGLGHTADARTAAAIVPLLSENFPELREAVSEALARLQDGAARDALLTVALERSATSVMATNALLALPRTAETDAALCRVVKEGNANEAVAAAREMRRRDGCPTEPLEVALRERPLDALAAVAALKERATPLSARVAALLSSQDRELRRAAFEALAEIGDRASSDAVAKAFEQERKVLESAREDWVRTAPPRGGLPTEPAPAEGSDEGRRLKQQELFQKVSALAEQKARENNKGWTEPAAPTELLDDADEAVLSTFGASLNTLGSVGAKDAATTLKAYLKDPSPLVREGAFAGLVGTGPDGLKEAAQGLKDRDRRVVLAVAQRLAELGEAGQTALAEALPTITGDKTRLLEALLRVGLVTSAAVEPLKALVREGGPEGALAAQLLGQLRAKEAVDVLTQTLDDPTCIARREVLLALGRIGDARAAEAVARDLYHDSPDVRAAAAEALGAFGGAHLEALDALKGDYYRKVREAARASLDKGPAIETRK